MDMIAWDDSFSVGHQKIDSQHEKLINMVVDLFWAMQDEADSGTIPEVLEKMADYARMHFETEERILESVGYPDLVPQKKMHHSYCKKVAEFTERAKNGDGGLTSDMFDYLKEWLVGHILRDDMKYKDFVRQGSPA